MFSFVMCIYGCLIGTVQRCASCAVNTGETARAVNVSDGRRVFGDERFSKKRNFGANKHGSKFMTMQISDKFTLSFPDKMTDDQFFRFCASNQNLKIERNENGEIEIMAPSGGTSGMQEAEIVIQLGVWNKRMKLGMTFSPSAGFSLPSGAVRHADAAWMSNERWNALTAKQQEKFIPAPDFVIELRSPSDTLSELQAKMKRWIDNGVRLAWLIDPIEEKTYIYRKNKKPVVVKGFDKTLSGEKVLPDFTFELKELK
jgi:Uma2 family endonuclease